MRIDRPESPDSTPGSPRAAWERARRWFVELGPPGRVGAIAALLVGLTAIGYLASIDPLPARSWLYPDHRFGADDARRIVRQLAQKSIAAQVVGGRIEVPADKLREAYDVVAKARLEPLSPRQIKDQPPDFNLFLTPEQLARSGLRDTERFVEESLRLIDPALSATVQIQSQAPRGLSRREGMRATVELTLDDGRTIPHDLVERVRNKVQAWLQPERLTLMDVAGTILHDSDDPALGHRTMLQARVDSLRAELLAGLRWIEDVSVSVEIEPGSDTEAELEAAPIRAEAEAPDEPIAIIRPNEPIAPLEPTRPVVDAHDEPSPPPASRPMGRANVMVLVPSRYYQRVARDASGDADLSAATIQSVITETEASIRALVASSIRADELGEVTITRFFLPPLERPRPAVARGESLAAHLPGWWPAALGAGLVAGVVLMIAAGSRLRHRHATGSPARGAPPTAPGRRPRFDVGVAEDAGPSERARALIRQDPAAAAGVLRRWIGQGGPDA